MDAEQIKLREQKIYEHTVIGQGEVRRAFSKKQTALLMIPVVILVLYLLFCAVILVMSQISDPTTLGNLLLSLVIDPTHLVLMIILPLLIMLLLFKTILGGYACRYKANNLEFVIYRKGSAILNLLYKDAVSVEYKPLNFLWFEQGFHVVITMKKYTLDFDYVELSFRKRQHPEDFPFEIIRRKIEELNAEDPDRTSLAEQREIIAQGTMRCAYRKKTAALLMIPVVIIAAYLLVMTYLIIAALAGDMRLLLVAVWWVLLYILPEAVVEILLFKYIIRGYDCRYKATETEFTVFRKNDIIMRVLFKDAVSVEYKPMKFLWIEQGFHVFIKTKNNAYSFDYIVPSRRLLREHADLPFEIIRNKTGE